MLLLGQLYRDDNTNNDDDDDTNDGQQWHMMDKSWLHRLIGMYAKWAKNRTCIEATTQLVELRVVSWWEQRL